MPVTGGLVITEFMANPAAEPDAVGEWFEVLVKSTVDLNGLRMTGNTGLTTLSSANCLRYDAGTLVVFANNADPAVNGNIAPVGGTFNFALLNTNGKIGLYDEQLATIDEVMWTTVTAGASRQLDLNKQDSVQNDVSTNFCNGNAVIVLVDGGAGDLGSPGAANRACP